MILQSLFILIYLINVKPFEQSILNKLEVFNELSILGVSCSLFLFTDFVEEPDLQYSIGWVLIGMTLFNMLTNVMIMVKKTLSIMPSKFKSLRLKLRKICGFKQKKTHIDTQQDFIDLKPSQFQQTQNSYSQSDQSLFKVRESRSRQKLRMNASIDTTIDLNATRTQSPNLSQREVKLTSKKHSQKLKTNKMNDKSSKANLKMDKKQDLKPPNEKDLFKKEIKRKNKKSKKRIKNSENNISSDQNIDPRTNNQTNMSIEAFESQNIFDPFLDLKPIKLNQELLNIKNKYTTWQDSKLKDSQIQKRSKQNNITQAFLLHRDVPKNSFFDQQNSQ